MKTITVLPAGAHVLDLMHLDHRMIKYVGYKQDKSALDMVKQSGEVTLDITDARYRMYYLNRLLAGDLLPGDEATAKWAGLPWNPTTIVENV